MIQISGKGFLLLGDCGKYFQVCSSVFAGFFPALQMDLLNLSYFPGTNWPTNDTQSFSEVQNASLWMWLFFHCELGHHGGKRPQFLLSSWVIYYYMEHVSNAFCVKLSASCHDSMVKKIQRICRWCIHVRSTLGLSCNEVAL